MDDLLTPVVRVIESHEMDCDGWITRFQRITIPKGFIGVLSDEAIIAHVVATEQVSGSGLDSGRIIDRIPFAVWSEMDSHDRHYWVQEGYCSPAL